MARAGISYIVGREDNKIYGETLNGVQLMDGHQFPDSIDPYIVPGDPSSGLCWGISPESLESNGTGDKKLQAYNFRLCITQDTDNMLPFTEPEDYDPARYELLKRVILQRESLRWEQDLGQLYLIISRMPNGKTDINNKGPMSTDFIGMNYDYPEADYERRKEIIKEHENYIKGLLYFLGHDPGLPQGIRDQMLSWGWAKDEFTDNGGFPHQMYVREARRMIGEFVMTEHHCVGDEVVEDGIGLAAYTMDSHNCQRIVMNGMVKNEGNVEVGGFPPYEISYRSLIPKVNECKNLTVPVCLSASNIAFGSIRMEPVFMVLGQVAAVASAMALDADSPIQEVDVKALNRLLDNDPLLDGTPPDIVIDNMDSQHFEFLGSWSEVHRWMGQYGNNYLVSVPSPDETRIIIHPETNNPGTYNAYYYCPGRPNELDISTWPDGVLVKITDAGGESEVTIDIQSAERDFLHIGRLVIEDGGGCQLEVVADNSALPVPFDALLLVPVK